MLLFHRAERGLDDQPWYLFRRNFELGMEHVIQTMNAVKGLLYDQQQLIFRERNCNYVTYCSVRGAEA
jgi:hypothetical protein